MLFTALVLPLAEFDYKLIFRLLVEPEIKLD